MKQNQDTGGDQPGAASPRAAEAAPVPSARQTCLILMLPGSRPAPPEAHGGGTEAAKAGMTLEVLAWDLLGDGPQPRNPSTAIDGMTPELFGMLKKMIAATRPCTEAPPHWAAVLKVSGEGKAVPANTKGIAERAMDFVRSNLHRPLTLSEAAAATGVCTQHFCRIFREETGLPFKKYLACQRTARARELLRTTSRSIKEIAYEVGFGSIAQFNRQFKRWQGAAPSTMARESPDARHGLPPPTAAP